MQLKRIGILALILLVITPAISQYAYPESGIYRVNSIDIELKENGIAYIREEVVVDMSEARILLPMASELEISDSSGKLEHKSEIINDKQLVSFNPRSYFPESDGRVFISYTSNHLTSKTGGVWTLKFSSPATPAHTEVNVLFPAGSSILELRSDAPRYPADLNSPLSLYPQDNRFSFECDYEVGGPHINDSNGLTDIMNSTGLLGLIITSIIILTVAIFIKRRKKDSKKKDSKAESPEEDGIREDTKPEGKRRIKESVFNMLDEREKEILRIIEKSGEEEITQAYIYKTTGIPKATLSDIMKRLESRNIIKRIHEGRTKWINLNKWIFD